MILTDYFRSEKDVTWDFAKQCGVNHGVIRLPEDAGFDITDKSHWKTVYNRFIGNGIKPIVIEPMPDSVHSHIKTGDCFRDESIEKVIKMFPIMRELGINLICFNWMAYVGWTRTSTNLPERGGATVTGFDINDYIAKDNCMISKAELWDNYRYFLNAVIDEAEKYEIKLALHPDDPPLSELGGVSRIMPSANNIKKAIYDIYPSDMLGITMCQACYYIMGEVLSEVIDMFADKIFFVHFRNVVGNVNCFKETFHDNGAIDMAKIIKKYKSLGINVPIRVDHVPTFKSEQTDNAGYGNLGRIFALGYLKGLLDNY